MQNKPRIVYFNKKRSGQLIVGRPQILSILQASRYLYYYQFVPPPKITFNKNHSKHTVVVVDDVINSENRNFHTWLDPNFASI